MSCAFPPIFKKYFVRIKKLQALFILFVTTVTLLGQTGRSEYTPEWKRIAVYEQKGRPESALHCIDSIMASAQAQKNTPQFIKAWIYRFRFLMGKDRNQFPVELNKMEQYTATKATGIEKSVLHSILAKLYRQYYEENEYTINNRTKLSGKAPSDLKEWTTNIFADTIAYHVKASLENSQQLQATPAATYKAIIESGKNSRQLQPTLFDFLCARGVETLMAISRADESECDEAQMNLLFEDVYLFILQKNYDKYNFCCPIKV
jgi:hypothetical protein